MLKKKHLNWAPETADTHHYTNLFLWFVQYFYVGGPKRTAYRAGSIILSELKSIRVMGIKNRESITPPFSFSLHVVIP